MLKPVYVTIPQSHRTPASQETPFILASNAPAFSQISVLAHRIMFHISFFFNSCPHLDPEVVNIYPLSIAGSKLFYLVVRRDPSTRSIDNFSAQLSISDIQDILNSHNDSLSTEEFALCTGIKVDFLRADTLPANNPSPTTLAVLERLNSSSFEETSSLEKIVDSLSIRAKPNNQFFNFLNSSTLQIEASVINLINHLASSFSFVLSENKKNQVISGPFLEGHLTSPLIDSLRHEAKCILRQTLNKASTGNKSTLFINSLQELSLLRNSLIRQNEIDLTSFQSLYIFHLVLGFELALQAIVCPSIYSESKSIRTIQFATDAIQFPSTYLSYFFQDPSIIRINLEQPHHELINLISEKKRQLLTLNLPPDLETLYLLYFDSIALNQQINTLLRTPTHTTEPSLEINGHKLRLEHMLSQLTLAVTRQNCSIKLSPNILQLTPHWTNILEVKKSTLQYLSDSLVNTPVEDNTIYRSRSANDNYPKAPFKWLNIVFELFISSYETQYKSLMQGIETRYNGSDDATISSKRLACVNAITEATKMIPPNYLRGHRISPHSSCTLNAIDLQKLLNSLAKICVLSGIYETHISHDPQNMFGPGITNLLYQQTDLFNRIAAKANLTKIDPATRLVRAKYECIEVLSAYEILELLPLIIITEQVTSETLLTRFEEDTLYRFYSDLFSICTLKIDERKRAMQANEFALISQYAENSRSSMSKDSGIMKKVARFTSKVLVHIDHHLDLLPAGETRTLQTLLDDSVYASRHQNQFKEWWDEIFDIKIFIIEPIQIASVTSDSSSSGTSTTSTMEGID